MSEKRGPCAFAGEDLRNGTAWQVCRWGRTRPPQSIPSWLFWVQHLVTPADCKDCGAWQQIAEEGAAK